jgi:hypothetical protein
MIRKIIFLFSLSFTGISLVMAQDYLCLYPGDTTFFSDKYGSILSMRIPEVEIDNETIKIYHLPTAIRKKNPLEDDVGCYTPFGASWLGAKYVVTNGNEHYFFRGKEYENQGIPFVLFTDRKPGEQWTCYKETDQDSAIAQIVKIDTMSFLGVTDSVKIIEISGHYRDESINSNINGRQIIISKNYGLVKTMNLYLFPKSEPDYPLYEEFLEYDLVGSNRIVGSLQNLTWEEIYDFEVGDIIHEKTIRESYNIYSDMSMTRTEKSMIIEVLDKFHKEGNTWYLFERTWKEEKIHSNKPNEYQTGRIKLETTWASNPEFNALPGEALIRDEFYAMNYGMSLYPFLSKTLAPDYINKYFINEADSCWDLAIYDGCFADKIYYKGLGGPFGYCDDHLNGGFWEHKLVYFKKGDETWGTPLEINLSIETEKIPEQIFSIHPVPVKDHLYLQNNKHLNNCIVEIMNLTGNLILSQDIALWETLIEMEKYPEGVYVYQIKRNGLTIDNGKIIKY